jgi:hypothetical protein
VLLNLLLTSHLPQGYRRGHDRIQSQVPHRQQDGSCARTAGTVAFHSNTGTRQVFLHPKSQAKSKPQHPAPTLQALTSRRCRSSTLRAQGSPGHSRGVLLAGCVGASDARFAPALCPIFRFFSVLFPRRTCPYICPRHHRGPPALVVFGSVGASQNNRFQEGYVRCQFCCLCIIIIIICSSSTLCCF